VVLSPRRIALINWRLNRICGIPPRSARSRLHSDDLQLAKDNDHCQNGKNAKQPVQPLLGQLVMGVGFDGAEPAAFLGQVFSFGPADAADSAPFKIAQRGFGDDSAAIGASLPFGLVGFLIQLMAGVTPVSPAVAQTLLAGQIRSAFAANLWPRAVGPFDDRIPAGILPAWQFAIGGFIGPTYARPAGIGRIAADDAPAIWTNQFR